MLVELGIVEQRYDAVKEVLEKQGTVTEVAERYGVTRQSLHNWLRRYRERGIAGLVDRSKRPRSCPQPHARPGRDPRDRAPQEPSAVGTTEARVRPRPQGPRSGAVSLEHLPDPGPLWARRAPDQEAQALGLPAVGAGPPDGALAARCHGGSTYERPRGEDPDRPG